ncbi:uncharacterized protein C12orf71 homolog [Peromyscus maniculatus bairdii]|uniref:uncharacterized protein C12orf71 homolog n=1 Tax=Peromyscus maniculatus bairdii TaxID=230844 RepID=UPI00042AA936|nr:uncharacterized protein C12orf71 homolog [Peromyscus maniculatus bairdii]XP_042130299.1 uncharacterized protein C12orf71 homolog [Peromyscus maniculatus bairdii]XP_042130300.1 uncharacterized protein C12orf71 homolog [Peromyscus maniculatus bairdii]
MTTSPSSSDYSSTEDSASECQSYQSLSIGHYPPENTFSYEEMFSCEEAASMDSSIHFLPPIQGTWGTESVRRLFRKRDQMEGDPEQFCKLSITLAWDTDVRSDHADSLANMDLNGHHLWMDKWPEDRTKLTLCKLDNLVQKLETFLEKEKGSQHDGHALPESTQNKDVHLTSTPPPLLDICQDLPKHKTPGNEDICQILENPPRLQKDEVVEISQIAQSSMETSPVPSTQQEDASHSYSVFCLNFRWIFHWLRTQVFSRLRREHPSQATTSWHQKAARKIHSLRGNRIQPQE